MLFTSCTNLVRAHLHFIEGHCFLGFFITRYRVKQDFEKVVKVVITNSLFLYLIAFKLNELAYRP